MPGLAGIISKRSRGINEENLILMIDRMMHESFYTSGTYVNDQLGVYAGWVCHKGSFSDCMPVSNEKKDLVLLFTGENFSDREVTDRLKRQGHEFDDSNASYLIHLYEDEQDRFLQNLNGWFSGLLVDLSKEKLVLFNDRYGMQRIYYYEDKDMFLFSSEAKSLLRVRPELREIDVESLGQFFSIGCVLQNKTLFSKIFLLPGGAEWTFRAGTCIKKDHYFKPNIWENQPVLDRASFYQKLRETFMLILPRYFSSRVPIALSLTGGLDTRMPLACIDVKPGELPCYTFGGMYHNSFDVKIARKVAALCQQPHQVIQVDMKFLSDFESLAEKTVYITDGNLNVSGSPELYVNKLAREIAPIRITGNYGGEVLRNIVNLKANPPHKGLFHPDFVRYVQNAGRILKNVTEGNRLTYTVFKEAPWNYYNRLAVEQSQVTLRSPYLDNDLVGLMYQAPAKVTASDEISLRLIADGNQGLRGIMTDLGIGGRSNYLFRMFARLYYEFLFRAEYYYNYGMPQWLARLDHAFAPFHLERLFLGRHKFHHFRIWFRDELSDYVRRVLLDERTTTRPYLNKGFLEEMVRGHTGGYRNFTTEITQVLTAELTHRLLIEQG